MNIIINKFKIQKVKNLTITCFIKKNIFIFKIVNIISINFYFNLKTN